MQVTHNNETFEFRIDLDLLIKVAPKVGKTVGGLIASIGEAGFLLDVVFMALHVGSKQKIPYSDCVKIALTNKKLMQEFSAELAESLPKPDEDTEAEQIDVQKKMI